MGMFKSIWLILTGMDKELARMDAKLDRILALIEPGGALDGALSDLSLNQVDLKKTMLRVADEEESIFRTILDIQASLSPPVAVTLEITMTGTTKGNNMQQVKDDGSVIFTLAANDAKGNPGQLDAPATWKSSDESLMTLNVSADGMTAVGVLSGKLGTVSVHVDGLAAGNALAADSEQLEITAEAPSVLTVSVAAQPPVAQTPPDSAAPTV